MEKNTYIPAERQKKIMEYIETNTSAQIHELAEKFHVSEATVRRDLDDLDQQGALRRTHGGAIKVDRSTSYESMYSEKISQMLDEKHRIAERAAKIVHPGDTVMIDSGTTTFFIAQALSHHENITIITNDLYIAYQTPIHASSTLIVTGGTRRQGRQELVGTVTENFIRDTHVDVAFIGVDGIDLTGGATNANFSEVGVKRLMLRSAAHSVIAADHTKFGRVALARICDLSEVGMILTDSGLENEMLSRLKKLNVQMELV
ncbi:MAG: DeoR/GlpR transcriptional regulator [Clostridia bacterium]|nr:DeoR/GlpR transcriptional regulator [Clostridia bacterium]